MKKDFLVVITDKLAGSRSAFNKNNLYCFESVYNILKHNITDKFKVHESRIFFGEENLKNEEHKPVLYIMPECFDITKKTFEYITSGGNAVFYTKKNKKAFACFDTFENLDTSKYFSEYTADYLPVQNLRELRDKNIKAQKKIISKLEDSGVQFASLDGVGVSPLAKISPGVIIYPGTIIRGASSIGANCILGPNTLIEDSQIGGNCTLNSTQIYSSVLENNIKTGPFCHIRPGSVIKNGVKLGNFVEIKNSVIGENTAASHFGYIGDSDVGARVNFGCGAITANYDGVNKQRCDIKDGAFIGSNSNLVAPITIGEKAYVAAGSTLTRDVPGGALAISRNREEAIKEDWVNKRNRAEKMKRGE